tara:strand:+ start:1944 stop:3290 length:1347 start_codon:yes stop_codon:yes gene_type:complete
MTIKITNDLTQIDYPRYDSYKDSGVDWLGEIPEGWNKQKLKYVVSIKKRIIGHEGVDVLSITQSGIKVKDITTGGGQLSMDYSKYQIVHEGDFAMNHMDLLTGYVDISNHDGVVSPDYRVFINDSNDVDNKYLLKIFQMGYSQKIFFKYGQGVSMLGRWRLPADNFNNFLIPVPSLDEQNKIIAFLESKTTQIDQAITLKQQQIAKLEEYKRIVIQNAVTKGLNPDAPMKDSGIDRVGSLPEHWTINKFRFSFKFQRGLNITKDDLRDKGVLCLNYGEIHSKYGFELLPEHTLKYVDDKYVETNHKSLLNDGDFVFADTSEDIAGSGNFSYINGMMQVFAGYHTLIAKPIIDFDSRFVAYLLDSRAFRGQVQQRVKGVKVYSITQSILKSTYIWLPPIDEQVKIVQELDLEMKLINETIQSYKTQIDRLKEYKTILINQTVTGKIKVS